MQSNRLILILLGLVLLAGLALFLVPKKSLKRSPSQTQRSKLVCIPYQSRRPWLDLCPRSWRLEVNEHFGDKVETSYVENVPEGPDAARVIRELARQGNKIIFTTSFGYMDPTLKVSKEFPDVKFEHITGYKRSGNMATGNIRFYEGRYVQGVVAGMMTKSNKIGYLASFPIPEVIQGINAFALGNAFS